MSNNIIDSIQLSGITYGIKGSGGTETIELTQAQYDALVDKDPNVFYIITDAEAGDLTNYYTKSETNTLLGGKADTATTYTKTEVDNAITAATSTKQDTLVSSQNIKTINNESILGSGNIDIQGGGGGGKAVSAGTNISITTGETADTINCTLPITASSRSIICGGYGNELLGQSNDSIIAGRNNRLYNYATAAFGHYNICSQENSSSNFGYSGNTLFSIGNGSGVWTRHNALDIRDNGDIYIANTDDTSTTNWYQKPMVRLQDTITATAANTTALGGLKLVKLTQSEYDSLATKDNSILYVIVN